MISCSSGGTTRSNRARAPLKREGTGGQGADRSTRSKSMGCGASSAKPPQRMVAADDPPAVRAGGPTTSASDGTREQRAERWSQGGGNGASQPAEEEREVRPRGNSLPRFSSAEKAKLNVRLRYVIPYERINQTPVHLCDLLVKFACEVRAIAQLSYIIFTPPLVCHLCLQYLRPPEPWRAG